jgi:hypothetical protein
MSGPDVSNHQDGSFQQPHLGLAEGTTPVLAQCTINGCTFVGISSQSALDHMMGTDHISCQVTGCDGRYSASQHQIHMWKHHQVQPTVPDVKPLKCQFVGCDWSTDNDDDQVEHEDELHTNCDVKHCKYRGTLGLYHIHASVDHTADEAKRSGNELE